ncbi:hypothetical protein Pelo_13854 [Pelomyxa schiedti]|nr:hypothetical protein Pelo_13854 [Pelomyxa schiedti]
MSAFTVNGALVANNGVSVYGNENSISGCNCLVVGDRNRICGAGCTVRGNRNDVSGMGCVVQGDNNHVSGMGCQVISGTGNEVSGMGCVVQTGGNNVTGMGCRVQGVSIPTTSYQFQSQAQSQPQSQQQSHGPWQMPTASHHHQTTYVHQVHTAPPRPEPPRPLQFELKTVPDEKSTEPPTCCVCAENKVKIAIVDCGHAVLCCRCARRILESNPARCPTCRADIKKGFLTVFV